MAWNPPKIGTKSRDNMPSHAFMMPASKKYPYKVKRNGKWVPSKTGLRAVISRANSNQHTSVSKKAQSLYKKLFK